jgi:hypothetical protein
VVPGGIGVPGRFRARQSSTTAGLRLHAGGETSAVAGRHGPATGRTRETPVQRSDQLLQQCRAIAARASTDDRAARSAKQSYQTPPPLNPSTQPGGHNPKPVDAHYQAIRVA